MHWIETIKINLNKLLIPPLSLSDRKIIFLTEKGSVVSFGRLNGDLFKPEKVLI